MRSTGEISFFLDQFGLLDHVHIGEFDLVHGILLVSGYKSKIGLLPLSGPPLKIEFGAVKDFCPNQYPSWATNGLKNEPQRTSALPPDSVAKL